jgi:hypothetical protein
VTEDSNEWNIAVCGLNCAKCPIYQAYHSHDTEFQRRISNKISSDTFKYPPEQIKCDGCHGDPALHWSPECTFKPCAAERGHTYCFECDSFPCKKLESFAGNIPHHKRTIENMKRMREMGLHRWIHEQKEKGQCLFCP